MKSSNQENPCSVQDVLRNIISLWGIGVLLLLHSGKLRFSEIFRNLPGNISKRMLSKTLRSLEESGLVKRTVYSTKPPSVEYELTELGYSFLPIIINLEQWATVNQNNINLAREAFNARKEVLD